MPDTAAADTDRDPAVMLRIARTATGRLRLAMGAIICCIISPVAAAPTPKSIAVLAQFCMTTPKTPKNVKCFWERSNATTVLDNLLQSARASVLAARDQGRHSALNMAAFALNADGVRALIAAGADVQNPDTNKHRPLHHAVLSPYKDKAVEQLATVKALLASGALADAKDKFGKSALDIAASAKLSSEVIAALSAGS